MSAYQVATNWPPKPRFLFWGFSSAMCIIIIIIIKCIYITQNRVMQLTESTVTLQTKMSSVYVWMFRLKCLGLEGQQEDCSMFEVPVWQNYGRRNSSWFVEQSVDPECAERRWRLTTDDSGWQYSRR